MRGSIFWRQQKYFRIFHPLSQILDPGGIHLPWKLGIDGNLEENSSWRAENIEGLVTSQSRNQKGKSTYKNLECVSSSGPGKPERHSSAEEFGWKREKEKWLGTVTAGHGLSHTDQAADLCLISAANFSKAHAPLQNISVLVIHCLKRWEFI